MKFREKEMNKKKDLSDVLKEYIDNLTDEQFKLLLVSLLLVIGVSWSDENILKIKERVNKEDE